jgi:cytochrome c biogenesis protein ResB
MQYFMVPLLVVLSLFAIQGTLYNQRTGNKPGFIIGGAFTLGLVSVTLLALYDSFFTLQ